MNTEHVSMQSSVDTCTCFAIIKYYHIKTCKYYP